MMKYTLDKTGQQDAIAALFKATFTDSEGAEEGHLIGDLALRLMQSTPPDDLAIFTARENNQLLGAILFTRLRYAEDDRKVMLLSPVAVRSDRQGQGIGQKLITHGLDTLRAAGMEVAITYGNPAYYGRVGFAPVDVEFAPPPQPLSQPQGWLAQSLTDAPLTAFKGTSRCAPALDDPAYW